MQGDSSRNKATEETDLATLRKTGELSHYLYITVRLLQQGYTTGRIHVKTELTMAMVGKLY